MAGVRDEVMDEVIDGVMDGVRDECERRVMCSIPIIWSNVIEFYTIPLTPRSCCLCLPWYTPNLHQVS